MCANDATVRGSMLMSCQCFKHKDLSVHQSLSVMRVFLMSLHVPTSKTVVYIP